MSSRKRKGRKKKRRKNAGKGSRAKRNKLKKPNSGKGLSKQESGRKQSEKRKTLHRIAGLVGILGAIATLAMAFVAIRSCRLSRTPPEIAVKYLHRSKEGENKVDLQGIAITPSLDDVNANVLKVPINLALKNLENRTLVPESIIVEYPRDLQLDSSGEARIDPAKHRWIYEHKIDPLEPGAYFTPLNTFEHLIIKVRYDDITTAIITADGVPTLVSPKLGVPEGFTEIPEALSFDLSIHFKNRAPYENQMSVKIMPAYVFGGVSFEWEEGESVDITAEDLDFAVVLLEAERSPNEPAFSIIDHWNAIDPYTQSVIDYKKVMYKNKTIQMMRIGSQLRRIAVDKESNSFVDYELWDVTKDGILDKKCLPNKKQRMVDWKKEMMSHEDILYFRQVDLR